MSGPESPASFDPLSPKPSLRSGFLRVIRFFRRLVACLVWILVGTGFLLRLTIRDQHFPWAMIYYLTPIPAFPIWLVLAGLLWRRKARPTDAPSRLSVARLNRIAAILFAGWTFLTEFQNHAPLQRPNDLRVVFWNSARIPFGVNRVAKEIRAWDPVAIGLVEANTENPKTLEQWLHELSDYQIAATHFGGMIAIKGIVKNQVTHLLLPTSWCEQFDVSVDGEEFTIVLVDISANLTLSRRQPLQELAKLVEQLSDRPLVIMGDFNTPDDSVLLEPLRKHCRLAFRERGAGYAATWPMPIPVLTLDQVWVNEWVTVSKSEIHWRIYSDHRPTICSLSFDAANRGSDLK